MTLTEQSLIYQGQFGTFTIDEKDRLEVIIYRLGLTQRGSSRVAFSG